MRVQLGINTCFALKRWPEPSDWASMVRNDLGLDCVELSLDLLEGFESAAERPGLVERTRAALTQHGLRARSTFTGLQAYVVNLLMHPDANRRAAALRWYHEVVDLTVELGATATGGHVGTMSTPEWSDPLRRAERLAGLKRDLSEIAAHAREARLECLMVENLVAVREPSTMADVADLLTDGDERHVPIRLSLDVGHQCGPGMTGDDLDPYAWLRRFGKTAAEIQLQQSDAAGDHHWPFTSERNAQGRIDAGRVLDTLTEAGAENVVLMLEIIPGFEDADGQVRRDLQASANYWRAALEERGLGR
jgi:sugar phosphate isomerase/epimerase